jgi:putative acetyltransferase
MESAKPSLRPAVRSDVGTLVAIRRDAILVLAAAAYGAERARVWADSSGWERVRDAIEQNDVWVAERQSVPAGWVEISRDRIEGIYVRPDDSRSGIGSTLLRRAESMVRAGGHRAVALDASANAEHFYLRRGYKPQASMPTSSGLAMLKSLQDP